MFYDLSYEFVYNWIGNYKCICRRGLLGYVLYLLRFSIHEGVPNAEDAVETS